LAYVGRIHNLKDLKGFYLRVLVATPSVEGLPKQIEGLQEYLAHKNGIHGQGTSVTAGAVAKARSSGGTQTPRDRVQRSFRITGIPTPWVRSCAKGG